MKTPETPYIFRDAGRWHLQYEGSYRVGEIDHDGELVTRLHARTQEEALQEAAEYLDREPNDINVQNPEVLDMPEVPCPNDSVSG